MKLSVVILNYNVQYFLEICIQSVQRALQHIPSEIIVVDNNSDDNSCAMVLQRFPDVRLIKNTENLGFPKGNNIGVDAANGEFICILNPDTVVAEDTFAKVLDSIQSRTHAGITGVRLIDGRGNFLPESKRGIPTPFTAFTKITGLYKLSREWFGKYYAAHLDQHASGEVEILVGAFMVMRRDLYLEVGGFDEDCFMYSDDIDLSYLVLKTGRQNYYEAATTVIHYKGESTVRDGQYMKRFRDAMQFFYNKHFRKSSLFSWFMSAGIFFFSIVKKRQGRTKTLALASRSVLLTANVSVARNIGFTERPEVITRTEINPVLSEAIANKEHTEIIFDISTIHFGEMIRIMDLYKHDLFTFRVLSQHADFVIGSDSSNDRGSVKLLNGAPA